MKKSKKLFVLAFLILFAFAQLPAAVLAEDGGGLLPEGGVAVGQNGEGLPSEDGAFAGQRKEGSRSEDGAVSHQDGEELPPDEASVGQGGVITAFAELPEDICRQETANPQFPQTVEGIVDGRTFQIPVIWKADREYNAHEPQEGAYVFTALLGEGYQAAEGVELPRIIVMIPPAGGADGSTEDNRPEIAEGVPYPEGQVPVNLAQQNSPVLLSDPNTGNHFRHLNEDENAPYLIEDAEDLKRLAELVNMGDGHYSGASYLVTGNIDLSAYKNADDGKGWEPIGTASNRFRGHFDGGGHSIKGLTINRPDKDYIGLFGYVEGGTIEDVAVEANVKGHDYVGGVVGSMGSGSTVQNCSSAGSVNRGGLCDKKLPQHRKYFR